MHASALFSVFLLASLVNQGNVALAQSPGIRVPAEVADTYNKTIEASVVPVEGANYVWRVTNGVLSRGQGTPTITIATYTGRIDLECRITAPGLDVTHRAMVKCQVPPKVYLAGLHPVPCSMVGPRGSGAFVPVFHGGSGMLTLTDWEDGKATTLTTFPVVSGMQYWTTMPDKLHVVRKATLTITGPDGAVLEAFVAQIITGRDFRFDVGPYGSFNVTEGSLDNLVRIPHWTVDGVEKDGDASWTIQGGRIVPKTHPYAVLDEGNQIQFVVDEPVGGELAITAIQQYPIPPYGTRVTTHRPKVCPMPDATITSVDAVAENARKVQASVPTPIQLPGDLSKMYWTWDIEGGVLIDNGSRIVRFDVTAKAGEFVTLRCTVTNMARTTVRSELLIPVR